MPTPRMFQSLLSLTNKGFGILGSDAHVSPRENQPIPIPFANIFKQHFLSLLNAQDMIEPPADLTFVAPLVEFLIAFCSHQQFASFETVASDRFCPEAQGLPNHFKSTVVLKRQFIALGTLAGQQVAEPHFVSGVRVCLACWSASLLHRST